MWRRSTERLAGMMERWKLEVQRTMRLVSEEVGKEGAKRHEIAVKQGMDGVRKEGEEGKRKVSEAGEKKRRRGITESSVIGWDLWRGI